MVIVHTRYGTCLTTTPFADWREVQEAFNGYQSSLGPFGVAEALAYLEVEYPSEPIFRDDLVRSVAQLPDGAIWATELTIEEHNGIVVDTQSDATAASDILERLDDLYDQRPDALGVLIGVIGSHLPAISDSSLGRLAARSRMRLLDVQASMRAPDVLNRHALAATDDLRLLCASTWAKDWERSAGVEAKPELPST